MNVPKIRFSGFEEEWQENKLCDIARITMGQSPNSENYTNDSNDTLLIQGNADLNNGKVIPRLFTKQVTKTCDKNDIIMTVRAPVGDIAISDYNACIGRGVCSIKSSKFVYHYLDYLKMKDYWKKISKGSTIDSITSDDIKSLLIKTPNKKEEEKIIKTIDLINKKIELQSKKIEDLKLFKKGLLYNEKRNNNSWNEYKISDIMNIARGTVIPKTEISECLNNEFRYPVYSSQTSNNGILGYDNKYDFNGKFLTWTTDGANAGKIFYREGKFRCTNVCGILYNKDNRYVSELTAELLNIETPKYVSYVGNPKLMNNVMSNIIIKLPDPSRDHFFSSILKIINKKLTIEEEKLDKLFELKKGLIQNMFV